MPRGSYLAGGGKLAGRFKRQSKRFRKTSYGISTRFQLGGQYESTNTVGPVTGNTNCIFASTPLIPNSTHKYLWLAVLKKAAQKMGVRFNSEEEFLDMSLNTQLGPNKMTVTWRYSIGSEPEVFERAIGTGATPTWGGVGQSLANDVESYVAATAGASQQINFKTLTLYYNTWANTGSVLAGVAANVYLADVIVTANMRESLRVQNRTGAVDNNSLNANNIDANPLNGRIYVLRQPSLNLRFNSDSTITENWKPNTSNGMVQIDSNEASVSTQLAATLRAIPNPSNFAGIAKTTSVILQPGSIKNNVISVTKKMSFSKFFEAFYYDFCRGAQNVAKYGPMQVFAFEKAIQTGIGTALVRLGYEKTIYFSCSIQEKRSLGFIPITNQL